MPECNDPHLCSNCSRNAEWPECMKDTELRGYHPVFTDSWDDVVECSNVDHYPIERKF